LKTEQQTTILERLVKRSFPLQELYEAKNNAYTAPLAELIIASDQIARQAQDPWEFKSLAQIGKEEFVRTSNLYDFKKWEEDAERELAHQVGCYVIYEETEGLLLFVQDEDGKYRVARKGDPAYDFVSRLRDEDNLFDLRFTKPPNWAEELHLGRENWEVYKLMWYDTSSLSNPLYTASKKLRADAVIHETWRRMKVIPGLTRNTNAPYDDVVTKNDVMDLVSLSKLLASQRKLNVGEACEIITTWILAENLIVYNVSRDTLPTQIYQGGVKYAITACFKAKWWKKTELENSPMPDCEISASDLAISKANASDYFSVPILSLQQGLSDETPYAAIPDSAPLAPDLLLGREHVSNKLARMNQAAAKFWANADREDRGTHPDNATVTVWLVNQGFSQTLAEKAATIIRPEWAPSGRKPEE
jgi:hypothetical protein